MKKVVALMLSLAAVVALLAACSSNTGSSSSQESSSSSQGSSSQESSSSSEVSGGEGSGKNYELVMSEARSDEINSSAMYAPISSAKTQQYENPDEALIEELVEQQREIAANNNEELSDEEARENAENAIKRYLDKVEFMMSTTFQDGGIKEYAISTSGITTIAYAVMIIMPEEGKHDVVLAGVESYVEQQQKACEGYLAPQYEIAKSAIIETAPSGEILLAMCEDARDVMDSMLAGLAG